MDISREMAKAACHALSEKKAEEIRIIDISEISPLADYFVIATGTNTNQIQAMVDAVEEELGKTGHTVKQIEGTRNSSWVLWITGTLLYTYFPKKTVCFMIWRGFGRTAKKSL